MWLVAYEIDWSWSSSSGVADGLSESSWRRAALVAPCGRFFFLNPKLEDADALGSIVEFV